MLIFQFINVSTLGTDKKLTEMWMLGMAAAYEGMQGFEFVHQSLFQEKVQGTIDRGRCGAGKCLFHGIENFVGANGFVRRCDKFKYLAAMLGETHTSPPAQLFSPN